MKRNGEANKVVRFAVVDGDPLVAEALRVGLTELGGFTLVAACGTGRDALAVLPALPPAQRPDLVLLEIRLQELDGYAVCRALREHWPGLLTALHTTHRLPCFVNGARHAGADAYFCKPLNIHQLAADLRALHHTAGLLIGQKVLFGGVTGSYALVREPRLSPRMEEVLELEAQGCRPKEIADRLGMGLQTVYTQLHRAVERVRSACSSDQTPESRLS